MPIGFWKIHLQVFLLKHNVRVSRAIKLGTVDHGIREECVTVLNGLVTMNTKYYVEQESSDNKVPILIC